MIRLNFENLLADTIDHLNSVQQQINNEADFEHQVIKAKSKWDSKTSTTEAKAAFVDIKEKLISMCSGAEICVYCEHNEASDIEHIYPKRLYPSKCFRWENYVFACGKCNTHFKKEKFSIFNPVNSVTIQDITPQRKVYVRPDNEDTLFINQRLEDPMTFLELDFIEKTFYFFERQGENTREYEKAKYTKDILGLNKRDDLVQHRKAAFYYFKSELARYLAIQNSHDMNELSNSLDGILDTVDTTLEFQQEKTRILNSIKNRIKKHNHPTVWKEMIRQRANLPDTNLLFEQVPEALAW